MAHLPLKSFFGYNFSTKKWAVPTRVAHDWLGYAILLMTLAQSAMGLYKLMSAREGRWVESDIHVPFFGFFLKDFEYHLQVSVRRLIPNSWAMFY